MIRKSTLAAAMSSLFVASLPAYATDYEITVTNLTSGIHFTPLLVTAHPESADVFEPGEPASAELQTVAEGGDTTALAALLEGVSASVAVDDDLLAPGESRTFMISNDENPTNTRLSIVGMLLPTNDGFVGLDSLELPGASVVDIPPGFVDVGTDGDGPDDTDGPEDGGALPIDEGDGTVDADGASIEPTPLPGDSTQDLTEDSTDDDAVGATDAEPLDPFGAPKDESPGDLDAIADTLTDGSDDDDGFDGDGPVDTQTIDVPTFVGQGPGSTTGSVTVQLLGYDAGTEANNEVVGSGVPGEAGFPAPQPVVDSGTGTGATGLRVPLEGFVTVHRGVQGDNDPTGGASDINAAVHGWMNPVARVTVTVSSGTLQ